MKHAKLEILWRVLLLWFVSALWGTDCMAYGITDVGMDSTLTVADTTVTKERKLGVVRRTIREFDRLQDEYIEPQHYEFTVMLQATRNFENFVLSSNGQSVVFVPDQQIKVGPYFGWRWFFLGYTFDLKNIGFFNGGIRRELDASIYSSQVGVDVFYRRTGHNYKLREVRMGYGIDGEQVEDMPFDGLKVSMSGINAYYIFNHGRFSYPAAFSQSTCQKVSCGSWMAGAGYMRNTLEIDFEELKDVVENKLLSEQTVKLDTGMMFDHIDYSDFNLSGGYAYNWVFARNWLLGASLQAALAYKTSYGKTASENEGFDFKKVNLDGIGRFALVYNNTRWYAGLSVIMRTNNYHTTRFTANNVFGSLSAYMGYNFGLKKKYRKSRN